MVYYVEELYGSAYCVDIVWNAEGAESRNIIFQAPGVSAYEHRGVNCFRLSFCVEYDFHVFCLFKRKKPDPDFSEVRPLVGSAIFLCVALSYLVAINLAPRYFMAYLLVSNTIRILCSAKLRTLLHFGHLISMRTIVPLMSRRLQIGQRISSIAPFIPFVKNIRLSTN
jgi:hypothetical protein